MVALAARMKQWRSVAKIHILRGVLAAAAVSASAPVQPKEQASLQASTLR